MISIQVDFDGKNFSNISYFKKGETEKRIRIGLGINKKDLYIIIKDVSEAIK